MKPKKPSTKTIKVSEIVKQDELIFRRTFVTSCVVKHGMSEDVANEAFDECLQAKFIVPARRVGSPPGLQVYEVAMAFAEITVKSKQ